MSNLKWSAIPDRILIICLLAFDDPDILRIGDNDMAGIFKDIENRYPVFVGGFHTDLRAVMVKDHFLRL